VVTVTHCGKGNLLYMACHCHQNYKQAGARIAHSVVITRLWDGQRGFNSRQGHQVKNEWSYTSTPEIHLNDVLLN
jgi:hypothetical protein